MPARQADAVWTGGLKDGSGKLKLGSGACECSYSFSTRFEDGKGSNPEELIAAAHAGCFSMALSAGLGKAGFKPQQIHTVATVFLEMTDGKPTIARIELATEGQVPDIDEAKFLEAANDAKQNCPVSRALSAVQIDLKAKLLK